MSKRVKVEKQEDKKDEKNLKVGENEKGSEKDEKKMVEKKENKQIGERDEIVFGGDASASLRMMMHTTVLLFELLSFLNLGDSVQFVVTCGFFNKRLSFRLPTTSAFRLPTTTAIRGHETYSISQGFHQMRQLAVSETQLSICCSVILKYLTMLTTLRVYKSPSSLSVLPKNAFSSCQWSFSDVTFPSTLNELCLPTILFHRPRGLFDLLKNCTESIRRLTTTVHFSDTGADELIQWKLCFENLTFLNLHSQMRRSYPRVNYKHQCYFWKFAPNLSQLILHNDVHSEESQNIARAGREGYLQSLTTLTFAFHYTDELLDLTGLKCLQTLTIFEFNNLDRPMAPAINRYSVPRSLEKICLHNVLAIPVTVLMQAPNLKHFELNCSTKISRWKDLYADMPDIHAINDACPLMEVFIIRDRYCADFLDIRNKLIQAQGWIYNLCEDAFTDTILVNLKIFAIIQFGRLPGHAKCASSASDTVAYGDPSGRGVCLCKRILGREDVQDLVKKIAIVRPNLRLNVEIDEIYIDTHCDGVFNSVADIKEDLVHFPTYKPVPVEKRKLFHVGKVERCYL